MRICSRSQSSFHIMLPTIMEPAALCTCGVLGGPLALITSSVSARHRVLLSLPNWFAFAGTLSSQPSLCQIFSASPLCLCLLLPQRSPPLTPSPRSAVTNATVGDRYLTLWRNHIFYSPISAANSIWSLTFQ